MLKLIKASVGILLCTITLKYSGLYLRAMKAQICQVRKQFGFKGVRSVRSRVLDNVCMSRLSEYKQVLLNHNMNFLCNCWQDHLDVLKWLQSKQC